MTELERVGHTYDGREAIIFDDARGRSRSIIEISGGTLRLGGEKDPVALDADLARALVATLQRWLGTGSFKLQERVKVVVRPAGPWEGLTPLVNAIRNCEPGATIVVRAARHASIGASIVNESYPGKDIAFRVGGCECGAERAAEDGRCGDGCDDD